MGERIESPGFDWASCNGAWWITQAHFEKQGYTRVTEGSLEGKRGLIGATIGSWSAIAKKFADYDYYLPTILIVDAQNKRYQTIPIEDPEQLEALKNDRSSFEYFTDIFDRFRFSDTRIGKLMGKMSAGVRGTIGSLLDKITPTHHPDPDNPYRSPQQ